MMREEKRCVIYVRVSTEMQVDGFSLDAQKNVLKKIVDRENMKLVNIYEDVGKSGKSIEGRPAFKKLLTDIENGLSIDYVVVYKLSRFGRNAADILNSLEYIQSYDINLIASEEGIDSSQTSGKLLISVLSAVSEIERENIIDQTMNGRKEKARQGGWNGGFAPYGYRLVNGKLEINEEEAVTVKKIFELYAKTNMGCGTIARELNLQGIEKVIRHNGKLSLWINTTIKKILCNPVYIGKVTFGRRTKTRVKGTKDQYRIVESKNYICEKGQHEPIIDLELWEQVRKKFSIASSIHNPAETNRIHLLSGLLKCPECGGPMVAQKTMWYLKDGTPRYFHDYRCNYHNGYRGYNCQYKGRILTTDIEPYIINIVKNLINNEEFIEKIKSQLCTKVDTSEFKTSKANYEKKLSQTIKSKELLEIQIDNLTTSTNFKETIYNDMTKRLYKMYDIIEELENNINDLNLQIKGLESNSLSPDNIFNFLKLFDEVFDQMTEAERREMMKMLIDKITFTFDGKIEKIYLKFTINKNGNLIKEVSMNHSKYSADYALEPKESISLFIPEDKPTKGIETSERRKTFPKEKKVTYKMIQNYVLDNFGLKAHTRYIAEIKRKNGLSMACVRETENPKNPIPHPTPAMTEAITSALKFYNLI